MTSSSDGPPTAPPTPCRELLRTLDWSRTDVGPPDSWPHSLRAYVAMVMDLPTPTIIFWGPNQTQLYNDGYSVIMGPRHPRYFASPYRECWPDTYPVIYPWMQTVLERGEVVEVDRTLFMLTRHGFNEEAYFTFTFSPLRDDSGAIAGILQPVVEVTDVVLAERRSETLRALETRTNGADAVDAAFAILAANPQDVPFALYYGWNEATSRLELVAKSASVDTAAVADGSELRAVFEAGEPTRIDAVEALVGGPAPSAWDEPVRSAIALPVRRTPSDRTTGVVVFGLSPCLHFDARYSAFVEAVARQLAAIHDAEAQQRVARDLRAREEALQAEAELQRARLQAVFMQAPVAITILRGRDHVVELANPLMLRVWGRPADQLLGRPLFDALPETRGQGLEALLAGVLESGQAYVGTERPVKIARLEGGALDEVFFNFVYEPMRDTRGRVEAVIVVAHDVTAHVRARRHKDEFLAVLGHELRNPLAPILTALELIRRRDGAGMLARERAVIERQARHMTRLVDDLLDVSRITRGKIELQRERVELFEVVATAIETASPLLEKARHTLVTRVPTHGLAVDGDTARLVQVFGNLLTNAAKYTDAGGTITVTAARDGDEIVASVSDTGRGIAPEMLPRLFNLFVQERQNLDRSEGGLGLGLAIARNLVELHGGRVDVHSDGSERGATFTVRLPAALGVAADEEPRAATVARRQPPADGDGAEQPHVLIVDDNEDAADLLADTLHLLGFRTAVAHDGLEALALAERSRFDAALLDIGLPVMDGYQVARRLRALDGWTATPLIAVTGYGQDADRELSRAAGFDHHLVKPIDLGALEDVLRALTMRSAVA